MAGSWPPTVNPNVQLMVDGARRIGKTTIVERVIVPALERAGYKVVRLGAERWQFDVRDGNPNVDEAGVPY